jgi:murein L,D-transpeptidase YafK
MLAPEHLTVRTMKKLFLLAALLAFGILIWLFKPNVWAAISPLVQKFKTQKTIAERVQQYGSAARARLSPDFQKKELAYPPRQLVFAAFKQEKVLEIYAAEAGKKFRFVRSYPILRLSGELGPKLREGDRQVPEGIYAIESLNPNSRFHLSLRVGYPNRFDREQGRSEGRNNLGGDIMIHGSSVSVGCLAMGDEAAEDLFVLAADTGLTNIQAILSPVDFRAGKTVPDAGQAPPWRGSLYAAIKTSLSELKK